MTKSDRLLKQYEDHDHRFGHSNQQVSDRRMRNQSRLNKKIDGLQRQWELLSEKLRGLHKQSILETRVEEKLRLETLINDTEAQRDQVDRQLTDMEGELVKVGSDAKESAGRNDDQSQYELLENQYNLISEKLRRLMEVSILSTNSSEKLKIEKQIDDTYSELSRIESELNAIEGKLQLDTKEDLTPAPIHRKPEKVEWTQVNMFIAFASRDVDIYHNFEMHLELLKRDGIVRPVAAPPLLVQRALIHQITSRNIDEGNDWQYEISDNLKNSQIILFLVSADFLASDYIISAPEVQYAFDQQKSGNKRVIPIIVRPVDWSSAPFAHLQVLPRNAIPATDTSWGSLDSAFTNIISDLRRIIEQKEIEEPDEQTESRYVPETIYPLYEVFKESGVPTVTFISPPNFERLKMAIEQPGRGVVIEGPSGIGKTTALKEAIHQLKEKGFVNSIRYLSARNTKDIEKLEKIEEWHHGIVAIDDFHRLQQPLSTELADRLKYLADIESDKKLIIVGIPHTRQKLIDLGYDIATRVEVITLTKTPDIFIGYMVEKGELALNVKFSRKADIINVANGSLNIAQILCKQLALREGIEKTQEKQKVIRCALEDEVEMLMKTMTGKYGKLVRTFSLLGGRRDPTCLSIIMELAKSEEGFLSLNELKYKQPHLTEGIDKFLDENYMEKLTMTCEDYGHHLFFDKDAQALIIEDPQLIFYLRQTPESQIRREVGMSDSAKRTKIFISYSHKDTGWLKMLQVYLKPLEKKGLVERWDDTRIKPGMKWRDEIKKALDSAQVAILLISSYFLASDFITDDELPPLLKAAEQEGALILPVILNPCKAAFNMSELELFQSINSPDNPLSGMNEHDRDQVFDKLMGSLLDALNEDK